MAIEGDNPAQAGTAQSEAAPKSARELFSLLETGDGQFSDEDEDKGPEADPQGDPEADDVTAEADAEGETEAAPDDAETEPDDGKEPQTIEIDGKSVSLDEVRDGYMRQQDYTRKTMQLSEERKEFSAAVQRVSQADQEARQALDLARQVLSAVIPQEPDLSLIQSDPIGYMEAKARREQALKAVSAVNEQVQQYYQKPAVDTELTLKQLQDENKLLVSKDKAFADPAARQKFAAEAIELGGKHYGLTAEEVGGIRSHKELLILKDAIAYRKLQAQRMQQVREAKKPVNQMKVAKPGPREAPRSQLENLRNLGSQARPRDIFALIEKG